jgi:chromosome segregation ATPase
MLLEKNEKIQKEIFDYKRKINSLEDSDTKTELNRLLMQIISGIKSIDQQHANLSFGGKSLSSLRETREILTTARKKLEKRIRECEQQGLIKG